MLCDDSVGLGMVRRVHQHGGRRTALVWMLHRDFLL